MSRRNRPWHKRLLPSPPLSVMVLCFWLLMNDEVSAGQLLLGVLLAIAIPPFAARLDREFARVGRLRRLPHLVVIIILDIIRCNITVARQVLGDESRITPGFVWLPLDIENIHGIATLTSIITLTPGTVSASLSEDRRHLLVHVLDLKDPEAVIDEIKTRYERPLMEIFP